MILLNGGRHEELDDLLLLLFFYDLVSVRHVEPQMKETLNVERECDILWVGGFNDH